MAQIESKVSGSARARTITPVIPPNFLSRSRLFPLFEKDSPGATLVIAPAGYGKTSLVAEWAAQDSRPTFWYTVDPNDSIAEFPAILVSSIQQVIPDFGADIAEINGSDILKAVEAINTEIGKVKKSFNFVIDNERVDHQGISNFAQPIIDMLSPNIHIVMIRRLMPETSLARYASIGHLSLITSQDLKFNHDELVKVAKLNGVNVDDASSLKALEICEGWPAAVQMHSRNIAQGNFSTDFASNANNPLGILALETYNILTSENKEKLLRLSFLEEFDLETAKILMEDLYSEVYINKLATNGTFITASGGIARTYKFNQIVFDVLSQINDNQNPKYQSLHGKLADHFVRNGDLTKAVDHAFMAADQRRFNQILRPAIREMAQIGRGDDLIRWSKYAGEGVESPEARKLIVKALGYLVNQQFDLAEATVLQAEAKLDPSEIEQKSRVNLVLTYVYFVRGELDRARSTYELAIAQSDFENAGRNEDFISLYRVGAGIALNFDDHTAVLSIYEDASKIPIHQLSGHAAYQYQCMKAMALYAEGKFMQAAEAANIAITQGESLSVGSLFMPLDAYSVLARCELEFSKLDKAEIRYRQMYEIALISRVIPWILLSQGALIRIEILRGKIEYATQQISEQRKYMSTLPPSQTVGWMVDINEAFLRYTIGDVDRADQLVARMPKIDMVKQLDFNTEVRKNPSRIASIIAALPENTPREKVYKWMSETFAFSQQENIALKSLRKAVELGAEVGFHEYFVRQNKLYPLFVKIATQQPTIYLENLVRDMTDRIQNMNADTGSLEEKLTARELEILKHLTTGVPISAIAKQLHISQNTMKTHLRNVYRKLSVDGRHSAVEKAQKLLLI